MYSYSAIYSLLPETLRSLVGDGSYPPSVWHRPLAPIIGRGRLGLSSTPKPPVKPFQNPLRLLTYPDVLLLLFFNGIVCAVTYGITATISVLFSRSYPFLSESDIGLCFLASGGGMIFGSLFTGKLLDRDYRTIKNQMVRRFEELDGEKEMRAEEITNEEHFPIERARLRTMPIYLVLFSVSTIGYGWCLHANVNIAVPLILHIISRSLFLPSGSESLINLYFSRIYVHIDYEHYTDINCRPSPNPRIIYHCMRTCQ